MHLRNNCVRVKEKRLIVQGKASTVARQAMEPDEKYLFTYKGFYFQPYLTSAEHLDTLEDFEIRDSDVLLVTYPKSGTVWTVNILSLIYHEGHRNGMEHVNLVDRVVSLEYNIRNVDYVSCPSPRLLASHLPYYLVPKGLRNKRAKVIYVVRNPKDVLVSYYHFSKAAVTLEEVEDFGIFMERFLAGKVLASLWLDHVEGWFSHRDDFNILLLTYEEMKKTRKDEEIEENGKKCHVSVSPEESHRLLVNNISVLWSSPDLYSSSPEFKWFKEQHKPACKKAFEKEGLQSTAPPVAIVMSGS
nr:amine sulfotransferase-like [Zootoca vivipara]